MILLWKCSYIISCIIIATLFVIKAIISQLCITTILSIIRPVAFILVIIDFVTVVFGRP